MERIQNVYIALLLIPRAGVLLDNITCRIKPCKGHPPWPAGICTLCQPSALTLSRQKFRFVDNISFEQSKLVEDFLNFWRRSGHQRLGLLYGKYEPHLDVPLGVKATVAAIYEPLQQCTPNTAEFATEDPLAEKADALAQCLGLKKVGWMFTDLVAEASGTVRYTRNANSYFLSGEECVTAAWLQAQHPNPCKASGDGFYGSKFVTVICTGDQENQIHFEGYQVSDQCTALVRDNCLLPTYDAPELAYVKEATPEQYVPDVYFSEKDKYGNEVTRPGRPLPVEYLMVDVPTGMPVEPRFSIGLPRDGNAQIFPVEHRMELGDMQNFDAVVRYCRQFSRNQFPEMMSDFHFLLYLLHNDTVSIPLEKLEPLLVALKDHNRDAAYDWSKEECWGTVAQLIEARGDAPELIDVDDNTGGVSGGVGGSTWDCAHCTFHNPGTRADCEMCGLPKS